jgi:hypothetical protein
LDATNERSRRILSIEPTGEYELVKPMCFFIEAPLAHVLQWGSYVLSTSVVLTLKVTCGGKTVFVEGTSERRMGALQVPEFNIL